MRAGSPPQAWGRLQAICLIIAPPRFTPTGVGTAAQRFLDGSVITVHPHRRGDGSMPMRSRTRANGSPPQAWGRHYKVRAHRISYRFTPTGVGTAGCSFGVTRLTAVHPHRRGDGPTSREEDGAARGSPPQAWGRPYSRVALRLIARFTPTGVGTARASTLALLHTSVHPHRRGDGKPRYHMVRATCGSPPQAWGRHYYR